MGPRVISGSWAKCLVTVLEDREARWGRGPRKGGAASAEPVLADPLPVARLLGSAGPAASLMSGGRRRSGAPRWLISATMLVNTAIVIGFQVRASRGVDSPAAGGRAYRRSGVAFLASCSLISLTAVVIHATARRPARCPLGRGSSARPSGGRRALNAEGWPT